MSAPDQGREAPSGRETPKLVAIVLGAAFGAVAIHRALPPSEVPQVAPSPSPGGKATWQALPPLPPGKGVHAMLMGPGALVVVETEASGVAATWVPLPAPASTAPVSTRG